MNHHEWIDHDGDTLLVYGSGKHEGGVILSARDASDGEAAAVELTRDRALELYHALGDHLMVTDPNPLPDATADGYDWTQDIRQPESTESTVATEAHGLVYGNREDDYGHPREDFTRTAIVWTGLLHHKLADGQFIDAEDIARCMVGVKLSRDVHSPKRDNRVDGIGYFITLDRLETGK